MLSVNLTYGGCALALDLDQANLHVLIPCQHLGFQVRLHRD